MDATLQSVERRVTPSPLNQFVVSAILDKAPMIKSEDAVGEANRGQAVGDDENRAPCHDLLHILLDDTFAFVVERACRLIENEYVRRGYERARNGDTLPLAT